MRINAWLVAGLLAGSSAAAIAALAPDVTVAVSDTARGKDVEADARRHPGELATFAQIKPGDIVVDLIPGSGYFTRVFSRIVGPRGHVYAIWPNEYITDDAEDVALMQALAKDPHYGNVTILTQPGAKFAVPVPADVVWTSQNYHDYPDKFMGRIDPKVLNDAVFKALKPGGVFVIVDHVAEAGSGMRDTDTLHRIDPQIVKKQVVAAGFKFDGETAVLRNPADDHKKKVFDDAIRGHTDQFAFRFRKP